MTWNLTDLTKAADRALETLSNPRQRAIAANYRLHAMLEVAGRWPEIFEPRMTSPTPFYRIASAEGVMELDGAEAVQTFYRGLEAADATVMILQHESLVIVDNGFASEALYNTFLKGEAAIGRGHAGVDPQGTYIESRWICMYWPYDARGRMIGERVYPAPTARLVACPAAEFLTVEDARRVFDPLIAEAQSRLAGA